MCSTVIWDRHGTLSQAVYKSLLDMKLINNPLRMFIYADEANFLVKYD